MAPPVAFNGAMMARCIRSPWGTRRWLSWAPVGRSHRIAPVVLGTWAPAMVAGRRAKPSSVAEALCGHQQASGSVEAQGDILFGRLHSRIPPSARSRPAPASSTSPEPAWTVRDVVRSTALPPMGAPGTRRSPVPPRSSSSGRPPTSASRRPRVRPPRRGSVSPVADRTRWPRRSTASPARPWAFLPINRASSSWSGPQPRRRTAVPPTACGHHPALGLSRRAPQARQFLADLHHGMARW